MVFLILAVVFAAISFAMTRRIGASVITFALVWFVSYIGYPTIAFGFIGLPLLLLLTVIITGVYELILAEMHGENKRGLGISIGLVVWFVWLFMIPFFSTSSIFHADAYRSLLGDPQESVFSTDTSPVDPTQIRIVDESVATRLGDKKLGEEPALGSQVNLGRMNIQQVNGQLYWVAPLNHSGFFKYLSNRRGSRGYVMVSATNESDVRLVQELDGDQIYLRYNDGNFFGSLPIRYLYTHGYAMTGRTDYSFEIDDSGRPYWVVTTYRKRVGFSGNDATGVITLDAQTGDIAEYSIEEAPAWIDRIQPEDFILSQISDWGKFVHGWWNPSSFEKLQPTPEATLVYGDDGSSYWYTGITSVGADEGTVGFMLVNTRTKEVRRYNQAGATETAAMRSAEGAVQEKRYQASFPILYNVGGVPTYFLTLKDEAGLVKMMSFVSVESYQIVGIGENIRDAQRSYQRAMNSRGNAFAPSTSVTYRIISETVLRFGMDLSGSNAYYSMVLEGHPDHLFMGSSDISIELPITQAGDFVTIDFDDGGGAVVDIINFDNHRFDFQESEATEAVQAYHEQVRDSIRSHRSERNVDAAFDSLPLDEKLRLLKSLSSER